MIKMPESKRNNIGAVAIAALVGGVAGAFVGLMVSPKSGEALRKDIQTKAVDFVDQVQDSTIHHAEAIKEKSTGLLDKGKKIKADLKTLIQDLKPQKTGYIDIVQSAPEEIVHPVEKEITSSQSSPEETPDQDDIITLP
jgi:gas vesicle protein